MTGRELIYCLSSNTVEMVIANDPSCANLIWEIHKFMYLYPRVFVRVLPGLSALNRLHDMAICTFYWGHHGRRDSPEGDFLIRKSGSGLFPIRKLICNHYPK
jgi:hypothetical protein